jgi:hypothetical protein
MFKRSSEFSHLNCFLIVSQLMTDTSSWELLESQMCFEDSTNCRHRSTETLVSPSAIFRGSGKSVVSFWVNHQVHCDVLDACDWLCEREPRNGGAGCHELSRYCQAEWSHGYFHTIIKCVEGNSIWYFDMFPMLQKLMVNLGSLRANKQA